MPIPRLCARMLAIHAEKKNTRPITNSTAAAPCFDTPSLAPRKGKEGEPGTGSELENDPSTEESGQAGKNTTAAASGDPEEFSS